MARMDRSRAMLFQDKHRLNIIDVVRKSDRRLLEEAVRGSAGSDDIRDGKGIRNAGRGGIDDIAGDGVAVRAIDPTVG